MTDAVEAMGIVGAASFLGVHPQTVRKMAKSGSIPSFKVGRQWRFRTEDLRGWTQTHHLREQKPLVLVVDDEKSIRETVRVPLEAAGYRVRTAAGGAEAIAAAQAELPDAVVLDLAMPDVSGADVLKEIRTMDPDLPVVVMTGYPEGSLMSRALEFSPFVVLAKPVDMERVRNTVTRVLRPTPRAGANGSA